MLLLYIIIYLKFRASRAYACAEPFVQQCVKVIRAEVCDQGQGQSKSDRGSGIKRASLRVVCPACPS